MVTDKTVLMSQLMCSSSNCYTVCYITSLKYLMYHFNVYSK